mgnify:CR=1 FL=1
MKKFLLSAMALMGVAAVSAQDVAPVFSEVEENVYAITMSQADMDAAYPAEWLTALGGSGVEFPDGTVLLDNDDLTIKAVGKCYVWTASGKLSQIQKECGDSYKGYVNLGSNLKDNNWTAELPVIYFIEECVQGWQSILSVTPKKAGKLKFGVYAGDNTRSIGIYKCATEEEMMADYFGEWVNFTDFRNDGENGTVKDAPAFTEGEVEAGRVYGLLGGGAKNLNLHQITFVPGESSGISGTETSGNKTVEAYYTLGGVRMNAPVKGVNIVKYSDGTTVKVVK